MAAGGALIMTDSSTRHWRGRSAPSPASKRAVSSSTPSTICATRSISAQAPRNLAVGSWHGQATELLRWEPAYLAVVYRTRASAERAAGVHVDLDAKASDLVPEPEQPCARLDTHSGPAEH